jgi:hypothetical protein
MPGHRFEKPSSVPATKQTQEDGFELVADPKDQVEVIGSDYEDADWDECEAPLKKTEIQVKDAASTPAASAPNVYKKLAKEDTPQEKVRKQMAAARKHLEPETKGEDYLAPPVEDFYKD